MSRKAAVTYRTIVIWDVAIRTQTTGGGSSTSAFGSLPIKRERYLFGVISGSETWHLASQEDDELHVLCGTCQSLDTNMVFSRLENGYSTSDAVFIFLKRRAGYSKKIMYLEYLMRKSLVDMWQSDFTKL